MRGRAEEGTVAIDVASVHARACTTAGAGRPTDGKSATTVPRLGSNMRWRPSASKRREDARNADGRTDGRTKDRDEMPHSRTRLARNVHARPIGGDRSMVCDRHNSFDNVIHEMSNIKNEERMRQRGRNVGMK